MSIPCKFERSILSYDEHEIILRSHHPEIYDVGLDDGSWRREPRMLKRRAGRWPCVARLSSLHAQRPATRPAKACVRPRTLGGGRRCLLQRSAASHKRPKTRKPFATPATADEVRETRISSSGGYARPGVSLR
jgi:hypothetical protein